jgi:ankyrin repeat protein
LLTRGVSINAKNRAGETALHLASEAGNTETVQKLLESNADAMAVDLDGKTALQNAVGIGNGDIIKRILVHLGKQEEADRWLATGGLLTAVKRGEEEEVATCLERGADPDAMFRHRYRRPVLHIAAVCGNTTVLRLLLDNGASVHLRGPIGATALHCAAAAGHDDGVRLLLERGADINAADELGVTPLHHAASFKRFSVVKQLLGNGANHAATDQHGKMPVIWMFRPGYMMALSDSWDFEGYRLYRGYPFTESLALFDLFMEKVTDPGAAQRCWEACLTDKSRYDIDELHWLRRPIMERLLGKGADVSALTEDGRTVLYKAAQSRFSSIIPFLLENGADVNQVNRAKDAREPAGGKSGFDGATALHAAASVGSVEITRLLVEAGADVNAVDRYGLTPLHKTIQEGQTSVINFLLENGVDVNNRYGDRERTVLHYAVSEGKVAITRCLIDRGADINIEDIDGQTALDIAKSIGQEAMIFLLHSHAGV